ncbi:MAG: hypothetical protein ACE5GS_00100 [Kiloniellaceae bacterium]
MNAKELKELLEDVQKKLEDNDVDEIKQLELGILARQLQMQMLVGAFDPLKDLDAVTVVDLSQLRMLTQQVEQEIQNERKRGELVDKILLIAKSGLKAAGVPIG